VKTINGMHGYFVSNIILLFISISSINVECKEKPDKARLESMDKQMHAAKKEAIEYYKKYPKLERRLAELVDLAENNKIKEMENYAKIHNIYIENNSVKVVIIHEQNAIIDETRLTEYGLYNIHSSKTAISAWVPINSLNIVAAMSWIIRIELPVYPVTTDLVPNNNDESASSNQYKISTELIDLIIIKKEERQAYAQKHGFEKDIKDDNIRVAIYLTTDPSIIDVNKYKIQESTQTYVIKGIIPIDRILGLLKEVPTIEDIIPYSKYIDSEIREEK